MSVANKETNNNMRYYYEQMIMKGYQIASFPAKELVVEVDAEEEDNNYIKNKFKDEAKLIDYMEKLNIKRKYN